MSGRNHQRGALLGLAINDALGAAVEFQPAGTFDPVSGYRDCGPHNLNAGEWTDDTSMALALADSLADVGWDLDDQAERYIRWWRGGEYSVNGRCFDIGISTSGALIRFWSVGKPANPPIAPNTPAETARLCGWPRCRSRIPGTTRIGSRIWQKSPGIQFAHARQSAVSLGLCLFRHRLGRTDSRGTQGNGLVAGLACSQRTSGLDASPPGD